MTTQLAVCGVKPNCAIGIFTSRHQTSFAATSPDVQALDLPAFNKNYSGSFGSDPEIGLAVLEEKNDAATTQPRSLALVEHSKSQAIEPNQTIQRPQPEITLVRLSNRNYRVLRQPIFGFFYVDNISPI